jgi:hypothetical protein
MKSCLDERVAWWHSASDKRPDQWFRASAVSIHGGVRSRRRKEPQVQFSAKARVSAKTTCTSGSGPEGA